MVENYTIPLSQVTNNKPRKGRAKKAIRAIKKFIKKHKRLENEQIAISKEVNEKIWENGMFGIPRKIEVELKEIEGKTFVFLKEGTELKEREKEIKKEKKQKGKEEKKTEEEIKAEAEKKKKLDEKRKKESDAEKVELKRKIKE